MRNGWSNQRRRAAVLRQVQARLEGSPTGALPWDETTAEVFADRDDLLLALQQTWFNRLAVHVDLAMENPEGAPASVVVQAWRELGHRFPGLRRVLDTHAGEAVLTHPRKVEHRLLAAAAGVAALADPVERAAAAGERLIATAATHHRRGHNREHPAGDGEKAGSPQPSNRSR